MVNRLSECVLFCMAFDIGIIRSLQSDMVLISIEMGVKVKCARQTALPF